MAVRARRNETLPGPMRALRAAVPAAILLVALASVFALSAQDFFGPVLAEAASISSLNKELEDTRLELQSVRAKIAKAELAQKAALGDIAALDKSIDLAEKQANNATAAWDAASNKLDGLQQQLDQLTTELAQTRDQLELTEGDLRKQQRVFDKRVASMYKSGGRLAYVAALLEPRSISQLLGRVDLLSVLVDQDNDILADIKNLKARVEAQRLALEEHQAKVAILECEQRAVTEELRARVEERRAALEELETAKAAKEKVVRKAEKDKAAWSKQEDDLLAESSRIAGLLRSASSKTTVKASSGILAWPVGGSVSSGFGFRVHPIFHVRKMHTGIDISAPMGASISAASAGVVVSAGWRGGYGKCVILSHGVDLATLYAHQSEILVEVGENVERGEVIGKVGSTGYSTGPHLHFEVRLNGSPVDPMGYL